MSQCQSMWPWQTRGIEETMFLLEQGALSVCVTSPTGMGKGRMIESLLVRLTERGGRCILFTDRKMLTKQTGDRFEEAGIQFGYVSATLGMDTYQNVLVASLQTMRSRLTREKIALPHADAIIIDEAHRRSFDWIVDYYRKANPGIIVVGFTASPVGLKGKYDHLVVAGTKPEGREGGALVPCKVIGMPEPDMRGVRMNKVGEYVHKGMVKRVMQCTLFADIFDCWEKHAKTKHLCDTGHFDTIRPTLVWAPGVKESRWIVDEFRGRGITAEHIDGETEDDDRERIRTGSRNCSINVVSSFGVMREGVDWPWVSYGILVQVCGAYETFVQLVGRILRRYPGKLDAILQDHSGAWHRHGSPNYDREWSLDDTNISIASERKSAKGVLGPDGSVLGDPEPICCKECSGIRMGGTTCPHCGAKSVRGVKLIRTEGGELVDMVGEAKPKSDRSSLNKHWASVLFRCGSTGKTFAQAAGLFRKETGRIASLTTDCFPRPKPMSPDWDRKIADIYPKFNRRRMA